MKNVWVNWNPNEKCAEQLEPLKKNVRGDWDPNETCAGRMESYEKCAGQLEFYYYSSNEKTVLSFLPLFALFRDTLSALQKMCGTTGILTKNVRGNWNPNEKCAGQLES